MASPDPASERGFSLGAVLTVTTGVMLATVDELYDLLGFMVGEPVWTHQLPRAADEAAPAIIDQHPALRDVEVPSDLSGEEHCRWWLSTLTPRLGESLALRPLDPADHTSIDPVTELHMMRPDIEVITVVVPGDES